MIPNKIRMAVASFLFAAVALGATVSRADQPKIPTTVQEHQALAKQYRDQAAQYTKVADTHRAMAEAAKKSTLSSHAAAHGQKDSSVEKMVKHCEAISKDADKLAADATKAADYHELHAKELQGK